MDREIGYRIRMCVERRREESGENKNGGRERERENEKKVSTL
jgi:hypothetical protein